MSGGRGSWGAVVKYADACVEGVSESCSSALDFFQLRRVVARAAGSVNLASGLLAGRLLMGRLNSPLLGMPVSIRKQCWCIRFTVSS